MVNALDNDTSAPVSKGRGGPAMKSRLTGGSRFAALKTKLANEKGVRNPDALASAIGRKNG